MFVKKIIFEIGFPYADSNSNFWQMENGLPGRHGPVVVKSAEVAPEAALELVPILHPQMVANIVRVATLISDLVIINHVHMVRSIPWVITFFA
jgi:hypothetical protein